MGSNIKSEVSQEILDIFLNIRCSCQSIRANQSSILVKYAPKECKKKDIRRVYYLWIYKCQKQSTFHYQLTLIIMLWALREKWNAKEKPEAVWNLVLLFHGVLLWRHNFPRRKVFPSCATQPIMGWHSFWKFFFLEIMHHYIVPNQ